MELLTHSRKASFRRCKRKHFYAYELLRRPRSEAPTLSFGKAWHDWLDGVWRQQEFSIARASLEDPYSCEMLEIMSMGYLALYAKIFDALEVLEVEREFVAPLISPKSGKPSRTFKIAGKIDAIVRERSTGDVYVVEHKTTSYSIGAADTYWRKLRLDAQISDYMIGAESLGYEPVGCIYDVARKPQIRPLKATPKDKQRRKKNGELYANQRERDESPTDYRIRLYRAIEADPQAFFRTLTVSRRDEDIDLHRHDVWQEAKILRDCQRENRWPKNPDACFAFSRACEYFPVCTGETSIFDESLYRDTPKNPELESHEQKRKEAVAPGQGGQGADRPGEALPDTRASGHR